MSTDARPPLAAAAGAPSPAETGPSLTLSAPAKLNLFLHVTGRRADGYHALETVFQFIDLADTVTIAVRDDGAIRRIGPWAAVPAADDLTLRAALALKAATGCPLGAEVAVTKRIPTGAGLGGGSSDAATVLLGLNRLWNLGLSRAALQAIGVRLGADVPVFVFGRNAYATGIGDLLEAVELPRRWYVLAMPATAVATASVFQAAELTRDTIPITITGFSECVSRSDFVLPGRNDLEPVVCARDPEVAATLAVLRDACRTAGVVPTRVRMTGSGACLFAVAASRAEAQRIATAFNSGRPGRFPQPQARSASGTIGRYHGTNQIREPQSEISGSCSAGGPAVVAAGLPEHPLGSRQVG